VTTAELIQRKRDGLALADAEIVELVSGMVNGAVCDAQLGALAMAVALRGMSAAETAALTRAMRDSGQRLHWPDLPGPVLDKHSTGGIGDCASLVLAPLIAACGGYVPMISGRGLGYTGGTLDKLEAIPGYTCQPDLTTLHACVREAGAAIVGASADLAPADGRLYAIRDVTATVTSTPLIVSSILSKKLAAGLDALVLDVKCGTGAGCRTPSEARALAAALNATAIACGLPCMALITDMNQPLASAVGNAVEVRAALHVLRGADRDSRLRTVVLALAEPLLLAGGLADSPAQARARLEAALDSGEAAQRFGRMLSCLGGPGDFLEFPERHLPDAPVVAPVFPDRTGLVTAIDARALGHLVVALGGGRQHPGQRIDHAVGLSQVAALGAPVDRQTPLALLHARTAEQWQDAAQALRRAMSLGESPEPVPATVIARVGDWSAGAPAAGRR
jgi:thymidine phosphorylase